MGTWIEDYLEYVSGQESPAQFHWWTGVVVIATVLGNNVWTPRRGDGVTYYNVHPGNLMVVLVGPPGVRKTSAVEMGRPLIEEAGRPVIEARISAGKLIHNLAELGNTVNGNGRVSTTPGSTVGCIFAPELPAFFAKGGAAEEIIDLLKVLYDKADRRQDYESDSYIRGKITISKPCLSMLACVTPGDLGDALPSRAQSTGYLSRIPHVYSNHSGKRNPLTDLDDSGVNRHAMTIKATLRRDLVTRLHQMKQRTGPYHYTPEALRWYNEWYDDYATNVMSKEDGWPMRRPDHLIRVSMCLAAAQNGPQLHTIETLKGADGALNVIEKQFPIAFHAIGQTPSGKNRTRILDLLRQKSPITSTELHKNLGRFFSSTAELRDMLDFLRKAGEIERDQNASVKAGDEIWKLPPPQ